MSDSVRNVGEKYANVLSSLNAIAHGTHPLENAANTVSVNLGDMDTTFMFAISMLMLMMRFLPITEKTF